MPKDETYYFHQTPEELTIELINRIDLEDGDIVLEPFKGEGSFYNNFPDNVVKHYTEIEEGLDYKDFKEQVDWVISNPPFRLETGTKRINSFFPLLEYYSGKKTHSTPELTGHRTLTPKKIKVRVRYGKLIR